jgi:hypothetical protein
MNEDEIKEMKIKLTTISRKWVAINKDITKMKIELKKKTDEKKEISAELATIMMEHSIECVNINQTDTLLHKQKRTKKPISKRFLSEQIGQIYSNDPGAGEQLLNIILNNRDEYVKSNIECKIKKIKNT